MSKLDALKAEMQKLGSPEKAQFLQRFFKTGPGQYAEGDVLLGITVPAQRQIAKKYSDLEPADIESLLESPVHEHRLVGLLILVAQYQKADLQTRKELVDFYLSHTDRINNWDLVDLSAANILGEYLKDKSREQLSHLARSQNLWERRIAIIATHAFIKKGQFTDTVKLSEMLLNDHHDLIHKAVGWMLREVGKRDQEVLENFLNQHYRKMPRTTLRYAIERLPQDLKLFYMAKS